MSRVCFSRFQAFKSRFYNVRCFAQANLDAKMAAWQIHSYGDLNELQFSQKARTPHITHPNEVVVQVQAASVNPIDVAIIKGYGKTFLSLMRGSTEIEFPLTLGRDFSGVVANKGLGVGSELAVGDSVWGVVEPASQGSHAEYVRVDKSAVAHRPKSLSYIEAAAVLYAGLTAYSGIMYSANMLCGMKDKRVLVLGAAGGVGSMAVQILKAGGATVITGSSNDALPLIQSLGVDIALDRNASDYELNLTESGPYDTILDCAGLGPDYASKHKWKYSKYVTFTTPLLRNFDEAGVIGGSLKSAQSLACLAVSAIRDGKSTRWAFVVPSADGIAHLKKLTMQNQLKPVVSNVIPFDKTPEAYKLMGEGHARGKIVIDVGKDS